jgi:SNF2 family DNA or RNA helicase
MIPFPHQIEAVYSRMLQVPQVRLLLADDQGAGKTIMAGMLIRELMARQSIERVLILVPPLVLKQWQDELKEKFNLDFIIINRYTLRSKRSNPFSGNNLCLTSMYWAAKDEIKPFVCEGLYVVDEAHKMAAYTHGKVRRRISRTKLYQLGEIIMRKTGHCLLLTATPHKGDMEKGAITRKDKEVPGEGL